MTNAYKQALEVCPRWFISMSIEQNRLEFENVVFSLSLHNVSAINVHFSGPILMWRTYNLRKAMWYFWGMLVFEHVASTLKSHELKVKWIEYQWPSRTFFHWKKRQHKDRDDGNVKSRGRTCESSTERRYDYTAKEEGKSGEEECKEGTYMSFEKNKKCQNSNQQIHIDPLEQCPCGQPSYIRQKNVCSQSKKLSVQPIWTETLASLIFEYINSCKITTEITTA